MGMVQLTEREERFILEERKRMAMLEKDARRKSEASVLRRDGRFAMTRHTPGRHATYAVYDGEEMICVCVYKKGANTLMDYLVKNTTEKEGAK